MRLFIGIDLPAEVKAQISDFVRPIQTSPKGWTLPEDYHLTLFFIGEVPDEEVSKIKKRMDHISHRTFEVRLTSFDFFNRRILYLGVEPAGKLIAFKNLLEPNFSEWLKPETKPFTPHITVKRWQRHEYEQLESGIKSRTFPVQKFRATALALFKSDKDSPDHKYHVIHQVAFSH